MSNFKTLIIRSKQRQTHFILFSLIFSSFQLFSQPNIVWQTSLGSTLDDFVAGNKSTGGQLSEMSQALDITSDGGCVIAGASYGNDGDVTGHHGTNLFSDYWVVKLDSNGFIDWQLSLGGDYDDIAFAVEQTSDEGYIIAGKSYSSNGNVSNHYGTTQTSDSWVVRLDKNANIKWDKSFGGSSDEQATCIRQTSDGGFIMASWATSDDFDVVGIHKDTLSYAKDYWVVKMDSIGNIEWSKCYGGSGFDQAASIDFTSDNGYIITGSSNSNDGDVTNPQNIGGILRAWTLKIDSVGNILWKRLHGGPILFISTNTREMSNGRFLTCNMTVGIGGNVTNHNGSMDYSMSVLDANGNFVSNKCFGGSEAEFPVWMDYTQDGGFIINGYSKSSDIDVSGNHGGADYWVMKLDSSGQNIVWQQSYGGSGNDDGAFIKQSNDNGFFIVGSSTSNNGDVSGHHGSTNTTDIWVAKLGADPIGISENNNHLRSVNIFPNPANNYALIQLDLVAQDNLSIKIYDLTGKEIEEIQFEALNPGAHELRWDIEESLKDGIYFLEIIGSNFHYSDKIYVSR